MSYLSALMKNVPEDEMSSCFVKSTVEEQQVVIVPEVSKQTEKLKEDKPQNKNALRRKKSSRTPKKVNKTPSDPNFIDALKKAQVEMMKHCKPDKDQDAIISQSIEYVHNWGGLRINVDLSDDNVLVNHEDKDYTFSKQRILSNKYFQNDLSDYYSKEYGNVFLSFYQPKHEKSVYKIHVKAAR